MTRRAKDGLPARISGLWTQDKLTYVQKYAAAFMGAMAPKRKEGKWDRLVYLDLLAGPGRGIDRKTGVEFDGSPLRALKIQPPFNRLFFADLSPKNVNALRQRIPQQDLSRVYIQDGDCNALAERVAGQLSTRTLSLAFVDPEGFEATFEMFRAFATRRIDLLLLFPTGGIARNLHLFAKASDSRLDKFMGGREWRDLPEVKLAAGKKLSPQEFQRLKVPLVNLFREKMAAIGFDHQDEHDPRLQNRRNVSMYHLLYFSKDSAGLKIWRGIKKIEPSGQRALPLR